MEQKFKKWFQSEWVWILLIAAVTAISSEIKLSPFSGENFRFGLGSITFLLMLLIRPPKNYLMTGLVAAITVITFRTFIESIFENQSIIDSVIEHYPAGVFYFIYVIGFKLFRLEKYIEQPIRLGILSTALEIVSNSIEHFLRILLIPNIEVVVNDWLLLVIVAVFRSFFVVGLYSLVTLTEQKKRLEEQLTVGSGLYLETLYLQKSMNHIEQIMADSYDLYRLLKKEDQELSKRALHIAQEIHEVKKDSQRIYSGLSEIAPLQEQAYYQMTEILHMSIEGNRKYASLLSKDIELQCRAETDFVVKEQMLLMAVINNVVANAVESIPENGSVSLKEREVASNVIFEIQDTGKGIDEEDLALIFEPGYTTKFSDKGVAATGIGLSHVQEAIKLMEGTLEIQSILGVGTTFIITIPKHRIEKRGAI